MTTKTQAPIKALKPGALYKINAPEDAPNTFWATLYADAEGNNVIATMHNGDMFLCVERQIVRPSMQAQLYRVLTAHGLGHMYLDGDIHGDLIYGNELQVLA